MSSVASSFHETIVGGVGAGSRSRAKFRILFAAFRANRDDGRV
jgi:hypothetical protein